MIVRALLALRYRIEVRGLRAIARRGTQGILFLPSHPALIDPIIMATTLHHGFAPYFIADQDAVDLPVIRWLATRFRVRTILNIARYGQQAKERLAQVMRERTDGLRRGDNLVLYPAGHLLRGQREEIGANSSVETVLRAAPDVRVVLVRTRGLWGSRFGTAWERREPDVAPILLRGLLTILTNVIFFTPRRRVTLEFIEPDDLPRTADRATLNRYLEDFYNAEPLPRNTYVPYSIWEGGHTTELPEPAHRAVSGQLEQVPAETRETVLQELRTLSGVSAIQDTDRLAAALGLDSLVRAELMVWLEHEFGFPQGDADSLQTVSDVLLAASGEAVFTSADALHPVPSAWCAHRGQSRRLEVPAGDTVTRVFLQQARSTPDRLIVADQLSGARSYRDVITAVLALLPRVKALPGQHIGIMLPASVSAIVAYLTVLFAGKTPVLLNWTAGRRNMSHALELVGVERILTAQRLVSRLETQGSDFSGMNEHFVYLETLAGSLSRGDKWRAALSACLSWRPLWSAPVAPTAAILFTSGSENLPKAVPLSHTNLLTNVRDGMHAVHLYEFDRMLGMLPPFHSFGLTGNMLLPLCAGLPTAYHSNPTEGPQLAQLSGLYHITLTIGTPTFLYGIVRAATPEQLASLRLLVAGAEECPPRLYQLLAQQCPRAVVLEGYGITECSPIVALNDEHRPQPYTIGQVLPSLRYAIVQVDTHRPVTAGETGMLLLRGPSVFAGYLGPADDPFVEYDGQRWYRTGDLVCQQADGVLRFKGRLQRFVKLGGEMISLPAIEAVLQQCFAAETPDGPMLAVLATANIEHPELVLYTTLPITREQANQCLRAIGLSPLHNLRHVRPLKAIPVLGSGKVDYRNLQQLLASEGVGT
jgi:long-chain-fatty-acid--[acyl-carrier-protein] ligase